MPRSQKHSVTAPQAVHTSKLTDGIGLLKVAMFPGAIEIDVAKYIDRGIAALDGCSRLITNPLILQYRNRLSSSFQKD